MNNIASLKIKIAEAINKFYIEKQYLPTKIYLTTDEEVALYSLGDGDVEPSVRKKIQDGQARTFDKIFDLNIIWDAKEFKIE